ncbi:MAG: DUF2807 domain-containing protein, partial [Pseudomonadota bacterium]
VDVSSGVDANVAVGGDYSVSVDADSDDFDDIKVELKGRTLRIGREYRVGWKRRRGNVQATISMPALRGMEASSGASLDATGIDAGRFSIDVSSGASAEAEGTCESSSVDGSSGASVRASGLICSDVEVDVSSGASARVYASDVISADASSGASVTVYGDPSSRDVSKSSGGSVRFKSE